MKVFIWFLFFLPIVYAAEDYEYFDYFQFVQQWPPTVVCRGIPKSAHPEPPNFTIRGFWPSNFSSPEPLNCSGSPFNISEIIPLEDSLNIAWPNLTGDCNVCFWRTEWNHHGTCSEKSFTEFGYFSLALELKKHVDIFRILAHAHIIPSPMARYDSSDISDAIKHTTFHIPRLWCNKDNNNQSLLLGISVCYDLALAYIDCPPQLLNYPKNKCDDIVRYPTYPCNITDNGTDKKDEL